MIIVGVCDCMITLVIHSAISFFSRSTARAPRCMARTSRAYGSIPLRLARTRRSSVQVGTDVPVRMEISSSREPADAARATQALYEPIARDEKYLIVTLLSVYSKICSLIV